MEVKRPVTVITHLLASNAKQARASHTANHEGGESDTQISTGLGVIILHHEIKEGESETCGLISSMTMPTHQKSGSPDEYEGIHCPLKARLSKAQEDDGRVAFDVVPRGIQSQLRPTDRRNHQLSIAHQLIQFSYTLGDNDQSPQTPLAVFYYKRLSLPDVGIAIVLTPP